MQEKTHHAYVSLHSHAHTNTHTQQLVQESVHHQQSFDKLVERGTPTARPPGCKLPMCSSCSLAREGCAAWLHVPKSMCVWREIALLQLAHTRLGPHDELHTKRTTYHQSKDSRPHGSSTHRRRDDEQMGTVSLFESSSFQTVKSRQSTSQLMYNMKPSQCLNL